MDIRTRLKRFAIKHLVDPAIRLLFKSCRLQIENAEEFLEAGLRDPNLLALWHEQLLVIPFLLAGRFKNLQFTALISKSRDGQLLEYIKENLANTQSIRVAHDSKHSSIKRIIEAIKHNRVVVITPDGPQGPWKVLKRGVLQASYLAKANIWALSWQATRELRLPTPDKMKLPLPFQTLTITLNRLDPVKEAQQMDQVQNKLTQLLS